MFCSSSCTLKYLAEDEEDGVKKAELAEIAEFLRDLWADAPVQSDRFVESTNPTSRPAPLHGLFLVNEEGNVPCVPKLWMLFKTRIILHRTLPSCGKQMEEQYWNIPVA